MDSRYKTLKLLKRTLLHYRLSRFIPFYTHIVSTNGGFCRYFYEMYKQEMPYSLRLQRPTNARGYWFAEGFLKPRINCLKQAIKLEKELCKSSSL